MLGYVTLRYATLGYVTLGYICTLDLLLYTHLSSHEYCMLKAQWGTCEYESIIQSLYG